MKSNKNIKYLKEIISVSLFLLIVLSCVPSKKYKNAMAGVSALDARNSELESYVTTLRAENNELSANNEKLRGEYDRYRAECETTQQALKSIEQILTEEHHNLERVQKKLEEGMRDFESKGVEVYFKDGFLYVSLADRLLYKSGSASPGKEGKAALQNLALVLNDYPGLKVIVVGHTDDVPNRGEDNWSLSTERANGVVRILSEKYKVDASRLTAAGKGKYNPVADNKTNEGRARNRRTNIILNPDIERIWNTQANN
jgi:chemotaxis protein MotB